MAISYGSSAQSRQVSLSVERLPVANEVGNVVDNIIKYQRTETTTESVLDGFGAGLLNGNEVISATVTSSVDEVLVESPQEETSPSKVRFYNPRTEASVTFLGDENVGTSFNYDGTDFDTISSEVSETAGDVKRVTVRGITYGSADGVTVGDATGGGTSRKEKRFSNTDFARETITQVAFS